MSESCKTCRFYINGFRAGKGFPDRGSWHDDGPGGDCRIRSVVDEFPRRYPDDWCGEHRPVAHGEGE